VILTKYNREIAHQMVDSAPDGHVVEVKPAKRSLEQNRLYWAILSDISEQVVNGKSFEPSIWHVYFKQLFLPDQVKELPDGSLHVSHPSSSSMTLEQFSEYVDKVSLWAVEHEVKLSDQR
jgi:hypothetical protein